MPSTLSNCSDEQARIIEEQLLPLSIVACAGSGKTLTAVRRLFQIRQRTIADRGYVALLSFSNVAVDTFRDEYTELAKSLGGSAFASRVVIETMDSFLTMNVIRPHAYRTMNSECSAYLVTGGEAFLNGFKFSCSDYPREITKLKVGYVEEKFYFYYLLHDAAVELSLAGLTTLVERLGSHGAYTHELGRYWAFRTLKEQPEILRALAKRYPHIVVDEAQDVGSLHRAVLDLLIGAGVHVSLVGDPNQAIYEFTGADGKLLAEYEKRDSVIACTLTTNYRSIPKIVQVANALSKRADKPSKLDLGGLTGAFFIPYNPSKTSELVEAFCNAVPQAHGDHTKSAVLCRSRDLALKLRGSKGSVGQGIVKLLVDAALLRDRGYDYSTAYELLVDAIGSLFTDLPDDFNSRLQKSTQYPEYKPLKRQIWRFLRDPETGIPPTNLLADTEWHPLLVQRVKALVTDLQHRYGFTPVQSIGSRLKKTGLPHFSLATSSITNEGDIRIRVDTVHQAKGESLDAVLYVAKSAHVAAFISGTGTELGRIGYVALTRAKNLFWLGVPNGVLPKYRDALLSIGMQEWTAT